MSERGQQAGSWGRLVAASLGFVTVAGSAAAATTVTVSSLPALETALAAASPGDRIVLADGVYNSDGTISIGCAGTAEAPIVIEAASVGGAEIAGERGFAFETPAAFVVLRGFTFTHRAGTIRVPPGVHHCRVTRNVFQLAIPKGRKAPYFVVAGDDNEIDHNTFRHKDTARTASTSSTTRWSTTGRTHAWRGGATASARRDSSSPTT